MFVSVLIPCFNEIDALPALFEELRDLPALLKPHFPEVVFVDDGSVDGTPDRLFDFAAAAWFPCKVLGLTPNGGIGQAVREGAAHVAGEAVITYDADRAYPLADALKLLAGLEAGADVAGATPFGAGATYGETAPWRRLLSTGATLAHRARLLGRGRGVSCFTCGFRAWRREAFLECLPSRDGFDATAEMLLSALRRRKRVVEIPSTLRRREAGVSKMRVWRALRGHLGLLLRGPRTRRPAGMGAPPRRPGGAAQ
ncbi:MAG TPA: glycosyltransferase [Planctomycetota bacterium]|nr:glycosyltransferase [Planctomycetota bacterium]